MTHQETKTPGPTHWRFAQHHTLSLTSAKLIAILNITPDSFSDGGELAATEQVVTRARQAIKEGAAMLDIGGESTRPGASPVTPANQIDRVCPAIEAIRNAGVTAPISIDTTSAAVARAALEVGANAINDVSAGLDDPPILKLAAQQNAGLILMHRLRSPSADSYSTQYKHPPQYPRGVVAEVSDFLLDRAQAAVAAGVHPQAIVLDPGLGFGKSVQQNFELIAQISKIVSLGYPVLGAASRKSFLGHVKDDQPALPPKERAHASVAACLSLYQAGLRLFRVHDVSIHAEALRVTETILEASQG